MGAMGGREGGVQSYSDAWNERVLRNTINVA